MTKMPTIKPPTTKLKLNEDCWQLIFGCLFGDFRTLARMMQVCRQLLNLTAPVLYRQLDHPANRKVVSVWSEKKKSALARLLLTSSGYITSGVDLEGSRDFYSRLLHDSFFEFHQTPLTLDYFGLLKTLPLRVLGAFAVTAVMKSDGDKKSVSNWKLFNRRHDDEENEGDENDYGAHGQQFRNGVDSDEVSDDNDDGDDDQQFGHEVDMDEGADENGNDDNVQQLSQRADDDDEHHNNRAVSERRLATALTSLAFTEVQQIERWLSWTEDFAQLSTLSIMGFGGRSLNHMEELVIEFVTRHHKAFPGVLTEIRSGDSEQTSMVFKLSAIVAPKKMYLESVEGIPPISADVDEPGYVKSLKEFCLSETSREFLNSPRSCIVKAFKNWNLVLRQCRQLEVVNLQFLPFAPAVNWAELFTWAPGELLDAYSAKQALLGELPSWRSLLPSNPLSFHDVPYPPMSVKVFTVQYMSVRLLNLAVDGFRYTLEKVVFRGFESRSDVVADWSWPLSRLTVLELASVRMSMSILNLCPILEDLALESVTSTGIGNDSEVITWRAPSSLKRLSVIDGDVIFSLNVESIGDLKSLEYLRFEHEELANLPNDVASMPVWILPKMKYLRLESNANLIWSTQLLRSCPNLESFICPKTHFSCYGSWWMGLTVQQANISGGVLEGERTNVENKLDQGSLPTSSASGIDNQLDVRFNLQTTKMQKLWIGGKSWTSERINELTSVLNLPKVIEQWMSSREMLAGKLIVFRPDMSFPELCWIRFGSPFEYDDTVRPSSPEIDRLLILWMSRPKMRLVVTSVCQPSEELIETQLEIVSSDEMPNITNWFSEEFENFENELDDFPCVLEIKGLKDRTFYKLKQ